MSEQLPAPELEQYLLSHFDEAMERRYIKVYCQPVVRTLSRQLCGMEALARWEDPELGLLTPDKFIGVLERHRRIHELDGYIVRRVCEGYRSAMCGDAFVPVSINLSRLDYELCDIFEVIENAVQTYKMPRSQLCIEITESTLNDNEDMMGRYIDRFRRAGYPVWMDDFGSGYSSLNVLKDFEFDELKLDMKFLSDLHIRSKRILASLIHMAKQIGIQTLTEGVETEEQFEFLRNIGCEKVQGSLFGAPMPYLRCLETVKERGISWESPTLRTYYDDLGRLDVLSATPFQPPTPQFASTGREMNSIPLAILELQGQKLLFLFTNLAFDDAIIALDRSLLHSMYMAERKPFSLEKLPVNLQRLAEETRVTGQGTLHFVHNNEYYELHSKRLALHNDRCGVLVRLDNLTRGAQLTRQNALDEGLRQVYAIYDRVSILDVESDSLTALYLDSREDALESSSIGETVARYAVERIFPEDVQRYRDFIDLDTLEHRISLGGERYITTHLRTRTFHGTYSWKSYTLVLVRPQVYYMLVRDTEAELKRFHSFYAGELELLEGALQPEDLWKTLIRSSPVKIFWKDKQRRFLGASQSFLDFYGFESLDEILGKTDEEMGWHVHPDPFRGHEWSVLEEGESSVDQRGSCIAKGKNRDIIASKMPVYNVDGEIIGLLGHFSLDGDSPDTPTDKRSRLDPLTGLLNTRGLDEDLYAYQDEYERRHTDFARIDVSIEDLPEINRRYGYEFGDSVITAVSNALLRHCGKNNTVGRLSGSQFTILCQYQRREEVAELLEHVRSISRELQSVDSIPFTVFLSVGATFYSETESVEEQALQTQLRRLADGLENVPPFQLLENTAQVFHHFENLPLPFVVYKLMPNAPQPDALLIYANRAFSQLLHRSCQEMVGKTVRQLATGAANPIWFDLADRAALRGERLAGQIYQDEVLGPLLVTVNQVIGPGYCAFTYQPISSSLQAPLS